MSRWSYAASKALDEFLALSYWKENESCRSSWCGFFNTVGPRQIGRYGMVLPNFVRQALDGEPITVYGTGQQSRCFCDVRDTIEAVLRLVANDRAVGEVVNIGSDEEISIEGLAHVVKQRTKSDSPITYIPYDQAYEPGFEDMQRRVPALEKLQKLTGFRPRTPLTEIVDRVVAHFVASKEEGSAKPINPASSPAKRPVAAGTATRLGLRQRPEPVSNARQRRPIPTVISLHPSVGCGVSKRSFRRRKGSSKTTRETEATTIAIPEAHTNRIKS